MLNSRLRSLRRAKQCVRHNETSNLTFPINISPATSDGLEITHTLEYYGRMLFTLHLLPLLRRSPNPRVLTVLAGTMLANRLNTADLTLTHTTHFLGLQTQTQLSIMTTLFLDRLSADPLNAHISFIHNSPGSVDTGNIDRHHVRSWTAPVNFMRLLRPIHWVMGHTDAECAQRHVYIASSGKFGRVGPLLEGSAEQGTTGREGSGLFILNHDCDVSFDRKALVALRAKGQEEVWTGTMGILGTFV